MKRLELAIDPGFDGYKICVNREMVLDIPFSIYDITGKENDFKLSVGAEDFITICQDNMKYLLGERVRQTLKQSRFRQNAKDLDTFYTTGRFSQDIFKYAFYGFMGYALIRYEEFTADPKAYAAKYPGTTTLKKEGIKPFHIADLNGGKMDVLIGVALPHSQDEEIWANDIKKLLLQPMKFCVSVGKKEHSFDFKVSEANICHNSQVFSAMFAYILDEDGNYIEDRIGSNKLPALFVDAGYKTVGIFLIAEDGQVVFAESNMNYAMYNVNEAVAESAKKVREDITSYNVETYARNNEEVRYYEKDASGEDAVEIYNFKQKRDEEIALAASRLDDLFMKEFNKMLDVKTVLVAGGTGSEYYQHFKEKFDKRGLQHSLIEPTLGGAEVSAVYAVAVGLARSMVQTFAEE